MGFFSADTFADMASPIPHGKLRWRSRRGMLELDILLARFWDKFGASLSAGDAEALEKLLEYEDNDLLELILGNQTNEAAGRVLQMLRAGWIEAA